MIDLKKLEAKFNALFEEETDESFNVWLEEKRMSEIISSLGEGNFISINVPKPCMFSPAKHVVTIKTCNDNSVNTQYAMAA